MFAGWADWYNTIWYTGVTEYTSRFSASRSMNNAKIAIKLEVPRTLTNKNCLVGIWKFGNLLYLCPYNQNE